MHVSSSAHSPSCTETVSCRTWRSLTQLASLPQGPVSASKVLELLVVPYLPGLKWVLWSRHQLVWDRVLSIEPSYQHPSRIFFAAVLLTLLFVYLGGAMPKYCCHRKAGSVVSYLMTSDLGKRNDGLLSFSLLIYSFRYLALIVPF